MMFGQTSSPMYNWSKFGRRVLLHVLSRYEATKVQLLIAAQTEILKKQLPISIHTVLLYEVLEID